MSFASSQYLSPTYTNITSSGTINANKLTATGDSNLATTNITSGALNMSSGVNINASNSSISSAFLTCGLDTTIDRNLYFNTDGSSVIYNTFALQGGTTMNASNSTFLVKQLNVSDNGSLNMGSGTNINASNSSIATAFLNCGLDATIDRNLHFNDDNSSSIYNSFALQGGTTMNASNSTVSVKNLTFNPSASISQYNSSGQTSDLYFETGSSQFYFEGNINASGSINSNRTFTQVADVGLLSSVSPTQPSDKSHIGFVLNESVVNPISVVSNVSNNILTFTLPKGTFIISGVLQLDVPSDTSFNLANVNQSLGSSLIKTFSSSQLVPFDSPNDINVNIPIFNTVFNSTEQNFTLSALLQYVSDSYINVTANSYLIATRIA